MADATNQEKTEKATPKRRQDSRKKGEVAQSKEVVSMMILAFALLAAVSALGRNIAVSIANQSRVLWAGLQIRPESLTDYHALLIFHARETANVLGPFLLVIALAAVIGNLIQTGFMFSLSPLKFELSKINPLKGLKRFVSVDRLFDLAKSLVKMAVAGFGVWLVLGPAMTQIVGLTHVGLWDGLSLAGVLCRQITLAILISFGGFALIDLFYSRWRFEKKLKMTKQEVRDEVKQREGDPKVRAQIRGKQRELSRLRMIAEVASADVVVTNPTHFAVALRYERASMSAPTVVAKGRNHLAARIREEARKFNVPIVQNPPLAQLLYKTAPLNRPIPDGLFQAVAEVLAYITRLDPRRADQWQAAS